MDEARVNSITSAVGNVNLGDRQSVLGVINLWSKFRKDLETELKRSPIGQDGDGNYLYTVAQAEALEQLGILQFWPWGGSLEKVLSQVGAEEIKKHWQACLRVARQLVKS